ncbi:MAG: hypothetical protein IIC78_11020 [Chloroflexi bacterium]|nr:hypothetical protein [Chloroflexota bacterium]
MDETLVFIEENQTWIYILLSLTGLITFRTAYLRYNAVQNTYFNLEREKARNTFMRSALMLILIIVGLFTTFFVATFAGPAVPISARPTAMPTVSLLGNPDVTREADAGNPAATAIEPSFDASAGCQNPQATIYSPQDDETVSGKIDIRGAAAIPGFTFYKIEIRSLSPNATWRTIWAGTETVCETECADPEFLGTWDTTLITAGEYDMQLVVVDLAGNAPLPCLIRVRVLPAS